MTPAEPESGGTGTPAGQLSRSFSFDSRYACPGRASYAHPVRQSRANSRASRCTSAESVITTPFSPVKSSAEVIRFALVTSAISSSTTTNLAWQFKCPRT